MSLGVPEVFGEKEIARRVDISQAIRRVRGALDAAANGYFDVPARAVLSDGRALAMVAGRRDDPGVVFKLLTSVPANPARGRPALQGHVLWADDGLGEVTALLDGPAITALRTGAVAGLAIDALAPTDASTVAMLGTGAQAPGMIRAALAVRDLTRVHLWNRTVARAEQLARELKSEFPGVSFVTFESSREAVAGAPIVMLATRATEPLVRLADVDPQAVLVAVGAFREHMIEIDPDVFAVAQHAIADDVNAVLTECGTAIAAIRQGTLRSDEVNPLGGFSRSKTGGLSVFLSAGSAVLDWAVTEAIVRRPHADLAVKEEDER